MIEGIEAVADILRSSSHNLRHLAGLTGRDVFRFYNGCDLSGLNLEGQDLSGMNFDFANFHNTTFGGGRFDPGAFNRSRLDPSQGWLIDDFDFDIDDLEKFPSSELLVFVRIREKLIDNALIDLGVNYVTFGQAASVGLGALRKARQGKIVSLETAKSIMLTLRASVHQFDDPTRQNLAPIIEQPSCLLLTGGANGVFAKLSHQRLLKLLRIREYRMYRSGREGHQADYRDTAQYLSYFEDEYDEWLANL